MSEEIPSPSQSAAKMVDMIHSIAKGHQTTGPTIGKILVPPPDIQIAWNNIILTKEKIYINEFLLIGYRREVEGEIETKTLEDGHHSHKHDINEAYTATWITTDTLKVGDLVSVYPLNGDQLFIVESKLVRL